MARERLLGETNLSKGGTIEVPDGVMEALHLRPKPGERSKLLWTLDGDGVTVTKGSPQSDWKKTMLRRNGTAAVPRHIQRALKLGAAAGREEKVLWLWKGGRITVEKGK